MTRLKCAPKKSLRRKTPRVLGNISSMQDPSSSDGALQFMQISVQTLRKIGSHPLYLHPEVPLMNELQNAISDAILASNGTCTFDAIAQHISKVWPSLKRADGSTYEGNYQEAVLANLHYRPNRLCLFRRDPAVPHAWRVVSSIEEAREAARDATSASEQRSEEAEELSDQVADEPAEAEAEADDDVAANDSAADSADEDEYRAAPARARAADSATLEVLPLTDLQNLISEAIIAHGGSASFEVIYDHVNRHRKKLRGRDGQPKNTDAKRAILASLSKNIKSQPLFARDPARTGSWMIGVYNPHFQRGTAAAALGSDDAAPLSPAGPRLVYESAPSTPSGTPAQLAGDGMALLLASPDSLIENSGSSLSVAGSPLRKRPGASSPSPTPTTPPLTDMQKLLILIIHEHGGSCGFNTLVEEVSKLASKLKRRDGSHYSSDCGRAVKASLSNNTYSSPIFRRDPAHTEAWQVADRQFLEQALADHSFMGGLSLKRKDPQPVQVTDSLPVSISTLPVSAPMPAPALPLMSSFPALPPLTAAPHRPILSHAVELAHTHSQQALMVPQLFVADLPVLDANAKRVKPVK